MAITQIGNIAYINQNTLLNSQMQAAQLNAPNAQTAINIQEFSEKMQEIAEVRPTEESKEIDKDGQSGNKQGYEADSSESAPKNRADSPKREHQNIYGEDGILDIEV